MVTVLALIAVVLVLFAAAALSTRDGAVLADAPPDAADVTLPPGPVQPEDVAALRFSLAPRGYRMSEVDEVLDRLAAELADRDRRLALLEATIEGGTTPAPDAPAAAPAVDVVEAGEQDLPVAAAPVQAWSAPAPGDADAAGSVRVVPAAAAVSAPLAPAAPSFAAAAPLAHAAAADTTTADEVAPDRPVDEPVLVDVQPTEPAGVVEPTPAEPAAAPGEGAGLEAAPVVVEPLAAHRPDPVDVVPAFVPTEPADHLGPTPDRDDVPAAPVARPLPPAADDATAAHDDGTGHDPAPASQHEAPADRPH